jgi:hypothetical protein
MAEVEVREVTTAPLSTQIAKMGRCCLITRPDVAVIGLRSRAFIRGGCIAIVPAEVESGIIMLVIITVVVSDVVLRFSLPLGPTRGPGGRGGHRAFHTKVHVAVFRRGRAGVVARIFGWDWWRRGRRRRGAAPNMEVGWTSLQRGQHPLAIGQTHNGRTDGPSWLEVRRRVAVSGP